MKLFLLFSVLGIVHGVQFFELERHATCSTGKPRFPVGRPSKESKDFLVETEPDGDLYSNSVDMLALSQYIYELAELRNHARQRKEIELIKSLEVSKDKPKSLGELNQVIIKNLGHIKKQKNLRDAVDALDQYLSDKEEQELSDHTKHDRNLVVFSDDLESRKESRVHGIAVNKRQKRVEVVFRGTANVSLKNAWWDWSTNLKAVKRRKEINPNKEQQADLKNVRLHRGFAKVLLGRSKLKEGERPIDRILTEDVKPLMKPGYRLYVSGHSLGGAIATLFGFFAAADPELTKSGPVTVYTFAAPRVGGGEFRSAFTHMEQRGQIRHGRFHNKKDKVPQLPWMVGLYKHVGVEVRLRKNEAPVVDYPVKKSWTQTGQGIYDSITSLPQILTYHSCGEMLRRLQNAKDAFLKSSLEHEYRSMWGI